MGGLMGNTTQQKSKDVSESHEMEIKEMTGDPPVYALSSVFKKTGALLFINIGLSVLCLIIMLVSYGENQSEFQNVWDVQMYLAASAITMILLVGILFTILARRFAGLTPLIHAIFAGLCVVSAILLAIGSIGAAANVERENGRIYCGRWVKPDEYCGMAWKGNIAAGAAGVGFLTIIILIVQTVFHIKDFKSNSYAAPSTT